MPVSKKTAFDYGLTFLGIGIAATGLYVGLSRISATSPSASISPSSGGAGTTFIVSGSGFPPGNQNCVILNESTDALEENVPFTVNENGTFAFGIPYITTAGAGTYLVLFNSNLDVPDLVFTQD